MRGAAPPNVNLGPHHISETTKVRKLKFYIHLGRVKYSFWDVTIFRKGPPRGAASHSVNSGPPHISETVRARNLRFYAHLDGSSTLFECEFFPPGSV